LGAPLKMLPYHLGTVMLLYFAEWTKICAAQNSSRLTFKTYKRVSLCCVSAHSKEFAVFQAVHTVYFLYTTKTEFPVVPVPSVDDSRVFHLWYWVVEFQSYSRLIYCLAITELEYCLGSFVIWMHVSLNLSLRFPDKIKFFFVYMRRLDLMNNSYIDTYETKISTEGSSKIVLTKDNLVKQN
jgi:hypothetical protein